MARGDLIPSWLSTTVLLVATAVWMVSFGLSLVVEDYRASESINMIFLAVVSGVLAMRAHGDDDDDDDDEPRTGRRRRR